MLCLQTLYSCTFPPTCHYDHLQPFSAFSCPLLSLSFRHFSHPCFHKFALCLITLFSVLFTHSFTPSTITFLILPYTRFKTFLFSVFFIFTYFYYILFCRHRINYFPFTLLNIPLHILKY